MSFLTPLYLLGALAISLPVLFHMIRRMPRDRREFSSTMFLQPSPPKITRRSRIEHWLLLLLRALAVGLLALAFARPFLRESAQLATGEEAGRAFVVLLDRSASMKRDDMWETAQAQLEQLLQKDAGPADQVGVVVFDDRMETVCNFEQWTQQDPAQRVAAVTSLANELEVSWRGTDLGSALIEAAEMLESLQTGEDVYQQRTVMVLSDLQAGTDLTALQTYEWPEGVRVELHRIGEDVSPNNAGIQLVEDRQTSIDSEPSRQRVHIINSAGADRDEFAIHWKDDVVNSGANRPADRDQKSVTVIVPAGESRIVRVAPRPAERPTIGQLVLEGDEHEFDNTCYVPPPRSRVAVVALIGEGQDDPQSMRFYLPAAFPSLPQREIRLVDWSDADMRASESPDLVIATDGIPQTELNAIRNHLNRGGTLLCALSTAESLGEMLRVLVGHNVTVRESAVEDYAMLTGIDFEHPLFTSLNDPRYSDFTKVRFWKYRLINVDQFPEARVVASFDTGDAAILEIPVGDGRLILFAGGWQPDDSQLSASSKLVPMLNGLIDDVAGIVERRTTYLVGDAIPLAELRISAESVEAIRTPQGQQLTLDSAATSFDATEIPGLYRIDTDQDPESRDARLTFAVNLAPAESRTWPMSNEALLSAGIPLEQGIQERLVDEAAQRQLRAGELENLQKLWRWLVCVVIGLLILETLLASRAARQQLGSS